MASNTIDRERLGDAWRQCCSWLREELGNKYGKLKCSRIPERHGTRTSVLVSRIYDERQSEATLPWKFCAYCLNYDPVDFETSNNNWCLKLHINIERLYFPKRDDVIQTLKKRMPNICPVGFAYKPHPRQLVIERQFTHHGGEKDVVSSVRDHLRVLIERTYPLLDEVICIAESSVLDKLARRALAESKARVHKPAANPDSTVDREVFNRSIRPQLRMEVIRRNTGGLCRICGKPPDEIHIDHIISVADGGLTIIENLQVTCSGCNLAKGSGRLG